MVTFVQPTFVQVTFVHISNISVVTGPILIKLKTKGPGNIYNRFQLSPRHLSRQHLSWGHLSISAIYQLSKLNTFDFSLVINIIMVYFDDLKTKETKYIYHVKRRESFTSYLLDFLFLEILFKS